MKLTIAIWIHGWLHPWIANAETPKFNKNKTPKLFRNMKEVMDCINFWSKIHKGSQWVIVDTKNSIDHKDWRIIKTIEK